MKKSTISKLPLLTLFIGLFFISPSFAQKSKGEKNKFIEGKNYDVQFYEMKATGRGKALKSLVIIKGGKIEGDLMYEKLGMDPIAYRVTLDSTFTEDDSESRIVSIEAKSSKDKSDFEWEATVTNFDIEGTVTQSKNGVQKKKYEFSGSLKRKKK
jgi:hypothetical protein